MKAALKTLRSFWTGRFWQGVSHSDVVAISLAFDILNQTERLMTDASRDVLAERRRQVEEEGWTAAGDDAYAEGTLARAAACYADPRITFFTVEGNFVWPWRREWYKPADRRRNLVKAAALILAEIERLDRQTLWSQP
jgi:hypothetical protein